MTAPERHGETSERAETVHRVVDHFLERRSAGDGVTEEDLLADHPDLAPALRSQLDKLDRVRAAIRGAHATDTDATSRLPTDVFPGYELRGEISSGGQAVVYEAIQIATGRRVAIKVMRGGALADRHERARLEREVRVLAQLRHPNIVTIHESATTAGLTYFVMDYIEGRTLDEHVAAEDASIAAIARIFLKVCQAVHAAHVRGIIHRDLKPGNILVDEHGEPQVLDFGLAKVIQPDDSGVALTMTAPGHFVGSLPWASPEQAGSATDVDMRSDVYSLGVILFQLLTGRFPYELTGGFRDALRCIAESEPTRPRVLRPAIGDELETIVLKCLSKAPDRRYQTAGDLARDLRHYLDGDPLDARRDSTWYVLRKSARRYRVPVAIVTSYVLVITIFGIIMAFLYRGAENARRQAWELEAVNEARTFLMEMFRAINATDTAGRGARSDAALARIDLTAQETRNALADHPAFRVAFMENVAGVYLDAGVAGSAERWLEDAVHARRLANHDREQLAATLHQLGAAQAAAGHFDDARLTLEEALAIRRAELRPEAPELAATLHAIAFATWKSGVDGDPRTLFDEALIIRKLLVQTGAAEVRRDLIETQRDFAAFLRARNDLGWARTMLEQAQLECTRLAPPDAVLAAEIDRLLALVLVNERHDDDAERLLRQVLFETRLTLGEDHPQTAELLTTLALVSFDTRDSNGLAARTPSREMLYRALDIRRAGYDPEAVEIGDGYLSIARLNLAESWGGTMDLAQRSLAIYRAAGSRDGTAAALTVLARLRGETMFTNPEEVAYPYVVGIEPWSPAEFVPELESLHADLRTRSSAPGWQVAETAGALGVLLVGLGRHDAAAPLLNDSYHHLLETFSLRHHQTRAAIARLLALALARGDEAEERRWRGRFEQSIRASTSRVFGDDDGGADAEMSIDYFDDGAEKTIVLPPLDPDVTGARLWVYARPSNAPGRSFVAQRDHRLYVNSGPPSRAHVEAGARAVEFDIGELFGYPTETPQWVSLPIERAWLRDGANTFYFTEGSNAVGWEVNNLLIAIDTHEDANRSWWIRSGKSAGDVYDESDRRRMAEQCGGELMVRLELLWRDEARPLSADEAATVSIARPRHYEEKLGGMLHRVGTHLMHAGDAAAAERLLRAAHALTKHPWTENDLGMCLARLGRNDEAAEVLERSHLALTKSGIAMPRSLMAVDNMIAFHDALGHPEDGDPHRRILERLLTDNYEERRGDLGLDHPDTKRTLDLVIRFYEQWDRPERAEAYRAEASDH